MLKRRGARTDPCGTPFLRRRNFWCYKHRKLRKINCQNSNKNFEKMLVNWASKVGTYLTKNIRSTRYSALTLKYNRFFNILCLNAKHVLFSQSLLVSSVHSIDYVKPRCLLISI